jgi:hypothetical protein
MHRHIGHIADNACGEHAIEWEIRFTAPHESPHGTERGRACSGAMPATAIDRTPRSDGPWSPFETLGGFGRLASIRLKARTTNEVGGSQPSDAIVLDQVNRRVEEYACNLSGRKGERNMWRRTIVSLATSVTIAIACIATISTDAFAYRRGVGAYHGGVYRGGVYRRAPVARGVAIGVGAAAVGAAATGAYYAPRCGYYPYPPCY